MTALPTITRTQAWCKLAVLIADGLPAPTVIRVRSEDGDDAFVHIELDSAADLAVWALAMGLPRNGVPRVYGTSGERRQQHHTWGHRAWHGCTVDLYAYEEVCEPEAISEDMAAVRAIADQTSPAGPNPDAAPEAAAIATTDRPGDQTLLGVEEVAGPAVGPGPATATAEYIARKSKHANGFRAPEVVAELEREDPTEVWVAVRRRGINYHYLSGDLTVCGRSTLTGDRIPLAEALRLGCPRCPACQRTAEA